MFKPVGAYPVIVVPRNRLVDCADFYMEWLGFSIVFNSSWFIYLTSSTNEAVTIAFMSSDHPSHPPGPETFSGQGNFLTLQVEDAAAEYTRLKQLGAPIVYSLSDEPWGQRRFGLKDPAGMWIDVVEQINPSPGFWDQYQPANIDT